MRSTHPRLRDGYRGEGKPATAGGAVGDMTPRLQSPRRGMATAGTRWRQRPSAGAPCPEGCEIRAGGRESTYRMQTLRKGKTEESHDQVVRQPPPD